MTVSAAAKASRSCSGVPGALHLPAAVIEPGARIVTYCWGPGCNGATKAALAYARRGFQVKEMIGGYEYWVREGFGTETATGHVTNPVDPLTAPATGISCAC